MDRRRGDTEVVLQVGLRWRAAMQLGVGDDVRQVLPLGVGKWTVIGCVSGPTVIPLEPEGPDESRYRVDLEEGERQQLEAMIAGGSRAVRKVKRAQILLAAAAGRSDEEIARTVRVGTSTVYRTKRRFVEESLAAALSEEPRPGGKRKLAASEEVLLIALACSTPPAGRRRGRWRCGGAHSAHAPERIRGIRLAGGWRTTT
jgi:hypothetical protein